MLIPTIALALQVTVSAGAQDSGVRSGSDTTRNEARRVPVTDEMRRTAFKDPAARELLLRARVARFTQDSMLISYDAKSYQRISAGLSLRATARSRLAFRSENASRVRWHRDVGARVQVLGARDVLPFAPEGRVVIGNEAGAMIRVPYYPGKEQLWVGGGLAEAEVDERKLVHPIAEGSEAYYTFATGDSIIMTLPDGKRITLREIRITAREPKWNMAVGSFWFETERAHLVRAVYRLSAPMDMRARGVPIWVKPLMTPMLAEITAISVEYGLYSQRFWLPKLQGMEGYARVNFVRVPFSIEERYSYESVNALDSLEKVQAPDYLSSQAYRDSLTKADVDSADIRVKMREHRARADTLAEAARKSACATSATYTVNRARYDGALPIALEFPCDSTKLAHSPDLPGSIYDDGEELFGVREREELIKTLSMGLQPGWMPQSPNVAWGLAHTRFNRVEGFSTGAALRSVLGSGYSAELALRGSIADAQVNGDVSIARSNGRSSVRGALYRRLAVSSDFGAPLSFGSSLAALLYARDEGFYHRAWGAEVTGVRPVMGQIEWRLFGEQQWNAAVENRWSLFGGANDDRFIANVNADNGWLYGAGARWSGSRGLDPAGWRTTADLRLEAATGDFGYARGLFETTLSRGLGPVAASLTAAAGSSVGALPAQRHFFLGGLQTIRGQTAGTGYGEAFWMGRFELGTNQAGVRPVVFGDLGWAGGRDAWSAVVRPMSGVGIGASFFDGIIRMDLARGIHPKWQTRLDLYLEARF